jgi:serine/threonine protein kinase
MRLAGADVSCAAGSPKGGSPQLRGALPCGALIVSSSPARSTPPMRKTLRSARRPLLTNRQFGYTGRMDVLAPDTLLGGCRIEEVVGKGGMGVVYRARQLDLDRSVAVKVLAPELTEDEQSRRRFLAEARAASAVEHPNVLPVHGAGITDGGVAYLIMRYVDGEDLGSLVQRQAGPLALSHVDALTTQLGDALDAIHAAGYVHRDVKPRNVLVDGTGRAYLTDFGLAKRALATTGTTRSDQWVGTLDYVAPEQIRGEPVSPRADVYAMGGVLYFMLTGQPPFARHGDQAKLWAHLFEPPPGAIAVRPEVPLALDAVVRRALAKDPALRQPSAGALARATQVAVQGDTDAPSLPSTAAASAETTTRAASPGALRARIRRPRGARTVFGALTALGVAVVGISTISGLEDRDVPSTRRPTSPQPTPMPSRLPVTVGPTTKDVGYRPRGIVFVHGKPWVISYRDPTIATVNPNSGARSSLRPEIGRGATSIAANNGNVWVAMSARHSVLRMNPETGHVIREVWTPLRPELVALGRSGLWIACQDSSEGPAVLLRYDRTGEVLLEQEYLRTGVSALALGGGYAWIALTEEPRVLRMRPGGEPERGARLTAPAVALAYGASRVWASVQDDDAIARIDPRTGLAPTDQVGSHPVQLAVARGLVFIAATTTHRVVVLDASSGKRLGGLRVPPNPYAVAAGGGHVWVTGMGASTLTRIDFEA